MVVKPSFTRHDNGDVAHKTMLRNTQGLLDTISDDDAYHPEDHGGLSWEEWSKQRVEEAAAKRRVYMTTGDDRCKVCMSVTPSAKDTHKPEFECPNVDLFEAPQRLQDFLDAHPGMFRPCEIFDMHGLRNTSTGQIMAWKPFMPLTVTDDNKVVFGHARWRNCEARLVVLKFIETLQRSLADMSSPVPMHKYVIVCGI